LWISRIFYGTVFYWHILDILWICISVRLTGILIVVVVITGLIVFVLSLARLHIVQEGQISNGRGRLSSVGVVYNGAHVQLNSRGGSVVLSVRATPCSIGSCLVMTIVLCKAWSSYEVPISNDLTECILALLDIQFGTPLPIVKWLWITFNI